LSWIPQLQLKLDNQRKILAYNLQEIISTGILILIQKSKNFLKLAMIYWKLLQDDKSTF